MKILLKIIQRLLSVDTGWGIFINISYWQESEVGVFAPVSQMGDWRGWGNLFKVVRVKRLSQSSEPLFIFPSYPPKYLCTPRKPDITLGNTYLPIKRAKIFHIQ